MKKYIVQHTAPETEEVRAITEGVNRRYAGIWGFEYVLDAWQAFPAFKGLGSADPNWVSKRDTEAPPEVMNPYWEKFRVIDDVMERAQDGDFIAYLDIDAMVMEHRVDVAGLLPDGCDISIILNSKLPVNAGVIFFRVNELTRTLIARCLNNGPVPDDEWARMGGGVCLWEERRLYVEIQALMADPSDPDSYGLRVFPMTSKTHSYHPTQEEIIFHAGNRTLADKLILLKMAAGMIRKPAKEDSHGS